MTTLAELIKRLVGHELHQVSVAMICQNEYGIRLGILGPKHRCNRVGAQRQHMF
jgi:hypothetical protein